MNWRPVVVVIVGLLPWMLVSCGNQPRTLRDPVAHGDSHPFSVSDVPAGYELVTAGRGTAKQDWGDDFLGTDEPFTALEDDKGSAMVVSVTGFEGYQGGLSQASLGYQDGPGEGLEVDGQQAIFTPARKRSGAELVVVHGSDLAVRVAAAHATKATLVDVARRVKPAADHGTAPQVVDQPGRWHVVGSVDADAVIASSSVVQANSNEVPGPQDAYSAAWLSDRNALTVMILSGRSADLNALRHVRPASVGEQVTSRSVSVGGRMGVAVDRCQCGDHTFRARTVFTTDDSGALLVVAAEGEVVPGMNDLVDVAASVRAGDSGDWEGFVVEATGGPGLHPDDGEFEIARGHEAGVDWLLQTTHDGGDVQLIEPGAKVEAGPEVDADGCLKLSNRKRVCASPSFGSPGERCTPRRATPIQPAPTFRHS